MKAARPRLRLRVEQTAPVRGRPEENVRTVEARVAGADADLVVFPELTLTGYLLGRRAGDAAVAPAEEPGRLPRLAEGGPAAVYGLVERAADHLVHNAAVVQRGADVLALHRKVYLPTYGMFDEGRLFAPGRHGVRVAEVASGWRVGLLVCEDLWHPALAYLLALKGADVVVCLAAAAGRDVREGAAGVDGGSPPLFASMGSWELIARTTALLHGLWVVVCNRVGAEDGVTFAGGSFVAAPDGVVAARAPQAEEAALDVALERDAVRRARHPYAHLRDEDPAVTLRELEAILAARRGPVPGV